MAELDDHLLLAKFARENSEAAFTTLVQRYVNLVYSTALRYTGDEHAAQDVTQAVFIVLARKAGSLSPRIVLSGWLWRTARLTAANHLRSEARRVRRDQEAYMQSQFDDPQAEQNWQVIAPLLEDALARLRNRDRDAILMRFFENRSLREVGSAIGISEDAAKMRVNRALEKLRAIFAKEGFTLSASSIAATVSAHSVHLAPAGLAKMIPALALFQGAAAGSSTLTLAKAALKIMAWSKAKTTAVAAVVILLAAGTGTVAIERISRPKLSATDLSWADSPEYWKTDSRVLNKIPPVFILRPMRPANARGSIQVGERFMHKGADIKELMALAYSADETRMVLPNHMPSDHLDLMLTMPNHPRELLREELQKRYGLTAYFEQRDEDVLILQVSNASAPGLKVHPVTAQQGSSWSGSSSYDATITNLRLGDFTGMIETQMQMPVLDQSGLNGHYDIQLNWKPRAGESEPAAFQRALADQLGLALVPDRKPIKMLVVEKAN